MGWGARGRGAVTGASARVGRLPGSREQDVGTLPLPAWQPGQHVQRPWGWDTAAEGQEGAPSTLWGCAGTVPLPPAGQHSPEGAPPFPLPIELCTHTPFLEQFLCVWVQLGVLEATHPGEDRVGLPYTTRPPSVQGSGRSHFLQAKPASTARPSALPAGFPVCAEQPQVSRGLPGLRSTFLQQTPRPRGTGAPGLPALQHLARREVSGDPRRPRKPRGHGAEGWRPAGVLPIGLGLGEVVRRNLPWGLPTQSTGSARLPPLPPSALEQPGAFCLH